jgi:hypothetical protein
MSKEIIEITTNFSSSTILTNNFTYVINGEIHVLEGVTLNIEYNTLIMIRNGIYKNTTLRRAALIFDTGSTLYASDFYLTACNSHNVAEPLADNGGLWFVGSAASVTKDGIVCEYSPSSSSFNANKIYIYYLGSTDPIEPTDPIDPIVEITIPEVVDTNAIYKLNPNLTSDQIKKIIESVTLV